MHCSGAVLQLNGKLPACRPSIPHAATGIRNLTPVDTPATPWYAQPKFRVLVRRSLELRCHPGSHPCCFGLQSRAPQSAAPHGTSMPHPAHCVPLSAAALQLSPWRGGNRMLQQSNPPKEEPDKPCLHCAAQAGTRCAPARGIAPALCCLHRRLPTESCTHTADSATGRQPHAQHSCRPVAH
jgi:hypothetical protein